uniref:Uncharacterized protein n=1 Tax=viral metagenome TaxID=1070528 RepID=A0A6C0CA70_9ZZZZ
MNHLVLLLLKEFLPTELVIIIISVYHVFYKKIKPGQTVFESPCGHTLRRIKCVIPTNFICPINKTTFVFDKYLYDRVHKERTSKFMCHLTEMTENDLRKKFFACETCDKYWTCTNFRTNLAQKIRCFCGKNVVDFPCIQCRPKYICYIPGCCQIVYEKKANVLCRKHYQCKKCETPYSYNYDDKKGGWFKYRCRNCKKK